MNFYSVVVRGGEDPLIKHESNGLLKHLKVTLIFFSKSYPL